MTAACRGPWGALQAAGVLAPGGGGAGAALHGAVLAGEVYAVRLGRVAQALGALVLLATGARGCDPGPVLAADRSGATAHGGAAALPRAAVHAARSTQAAVDNRDPGRCALRVSRADLARRAGGVGRGGCRGSSCALARAGPPLGDFSLDVGVERW